MRVVVISDTHNQAHNIQVPDGDVLIHCGDATMSGTIKEVVAFNAWLGTLPHQHKIFCAGNHDFLFEQNPSLAVNLLTNALYLQDELICVNDLAIYASPWQPRFHDWAFNVDRGDAIQEKWENIPSFLDILITHGPPFGILDPGFGGNHVGCEELLKVVQERCPTYHVFGHLHEGYGMQVGDCTTFINAAMVDDRYQLRGNPIVLEI